MTSDISRRVALAWSAALLASPAAAQTPAPAPLLAPDDVIYGAPRARVVLIEYASLTCGACRAFHADVFPEIERRFITPGRIRFVLRPFLTAPPALSAAAWLVARAGAPTPAVFHGRIKTLFEAQPELFEAAQRGRAAEFLLEKAQGFGLTEAQFDAILRDEPAFQRIEAIMLEAQSRYAVSSTPTLVLNGTPLPLADAALDALAARLEAALKTPKR